MANMNEALDEEVDVKGTYTKKKPGAVVIDQFGEKQKRRRPVGMDVSDFCMPPLTKKHVATYRGIDFDKISLSTNQPADPITFYIPGTYMFYDMGEQDPARKNKLMANYARPEIVIDPVSKKSVMDDKLIDGVEFLQGIKYVDVEKQFALYVFMELHPNNRTNKFRPNSAPAIYERIDLLSNKDLAFKMAEADLGVEAEREVINIKDTEILVARAVTAGIPVMESGGRRSIGEIKLDLRSYARLHPKKFFGNGGDYKIAFKMNVIDALNWGLIELNESNRTFEVPLTDEKIFKWIHGVQEDPIDGLVEHCLSKEGRELGAAIKNMVEFWPL